MDQQSIYTESGRKRIKSDDDLRDEPPFHYGNVNTCGGGELRHISSIWTALILVHIRY